MEDPVLCAMILIILPHSGDALAPSIKQSAKSPWTPHQGTNRRSREILEWFLRVPGDNVEACCSGQSNMASGAQRRRVGVEGKLERDKENEDSHSVHENNGDKIQPNLWIAWTSQISIPTRKQHGHSE